MTPTLSISILLITKDKSSEQSFHNMLLQFSALNAGLSWVNELDKAYALIEERPFDIILMESTFGDTAIQDLIDFAHDNERSAPLILLAHKGFDSAEHRIINSSIVDYLFLDGLDASILEQTIGHVLEKFKLYQVVQQQESRFKGFFQQSKDGIFFTDLRWRAQNVNTSFKGMYALEKIEKEADLKSIIIPPEDVPSFEAAMNNTGEVNNFPISFKQESSTQHLLVSCKPVQGMDDQVVGYQGIIRDITAFKQAEKELAQAERFNLSGRMARIIAHEVRNPLSNISLAASSLNDIDASDRETMQLYIDILKRNSSRINDLIDNLLNSTRFSELTIAQFSAQKAMEETLLLCSDRLKLKEIKVNRLNHGDDLMIDGDFDKVVIVLTNIITNAIEAMEQTKNPKIEIGFSSDAAFAEISISDNGKGMDEATLQNLFDPFFTERHGGMGLGLSAVKHLINQHKGEVHVESALGKGTTFRLRFRRTME